MEEDNHHHDNTKNLAEVLSEIKSVSEMEQFLTDLCTRAELKAMKERWRVCQLLNDDKLSYREIHKLTNASLTTIGRVARFLRDEPHGGYRNILRKIMRE